MSNRLKINLLRGAMAALWIAAAAVLALGGWKYLRDNFWFNVKQGNGLFVAKKYEAALKKYHDAELYKPESDVLAFNSGNVFYKTKNYDKALQSFQKSLNSDNRDTVQKSHYNMGNVYFRTDNPEGEDKLQLAIREYISALEIDPQDVEAKYNLELARVMLKEKLKKKQDKEKNKLPDKNQKQNPNCPNPQQGQGQQQQQQQQAAAPKPGDKKQDEKKDGDGQDKKKDGEMTPQQAMKILRALDNKEKNDDKKKMIPIPASGLRPEKDW